MLKCSVSVTLVQLICNLLFLPPILSGFQVFSLILFTVPLLSYSLIHKKESNDLRCSTKKNLNLINQQDVHGFVTKFLIKFAPSVLILVIFHFLSLYYKCKAENEINPGMMLGGGGGSATNLFNSTATIMSTIATLDRNNETISAAAALLSRQKKITSFKYTCHLFAFDL
jgi:hypothetical protein